MLNLAKKLSVCFLVVGMLVNVVGMNNTSAKTLNGKISYMPDSLLGKVGHNGKVMTENDCAVDGSIFYSIPKGTPMFTKNNSNGRTATVYKWDSGYFPSGVVLDVFKPVFTNKLGGSLTAGYISNATVTYY